MPTKKELEGIVKHLRAECDELFDTIEYQYEEIARLKVDIKQLKSKLSRAIRRQYRLEKENARLKEALEDQRAARDALEAKE